jgi:hypothetical protein
VENGADKCATDASGKTPMALAAANAHEQVVWILRQAAATDGVASAGKPKVNEEPGKKSAPFILDAFCHDGLPAMGISADMRNVTLKSIDLGAALLRRPTDVERPAIA